LKIIVIVVAGVCDDGIKGIKQSLLILAASSMNALIESRFQTLLDKKDLINGRAGLIIAFLMNERERERESEKLRFN